jgi:hypothetical protein
MAFMLVTQRYIWEEGMKNMSEVQDDCSEVASLLSQIRDEYEAAQRGLNGFSYGTSQHEFINARMEHMGQLHTQLQTLVGDMAIAMIADQLFQS